MSLARVVRDYREAVLTAADPAMQALAAHTVAAVQAELSRPGTGLVSRRGAGRTHQASAPGQPPARDTSALYGSITSERVDVAHYRVGTPLAVGVWMEYGTIDSGGHVLPRPWLSTVRVAIEFDAREIVRQAIAAAARGVAVTHDFA